MNWLMRILSRFRSSVSIEDDAMTSEQDLLDAARSGRRLGISDVSKILGSPEVPNWFTFVWRLSYGRSLILPYVLDSSIWMIRNPVLRSELLFCTNWSQ